MTVHIVCTIQEGVLEICFNRPDKKNAITDEMYAAIIKAMNAAKDDERVGAVLFTAVGDYFSAGNDLADFLAVGQHGGDMQAWAFVQLLADYPKPIIAAVTGAGVGIGMTLLLHCDLVYIHKDARLSVPFVNLALVPEAASSLLLTARIGHAKAFEMFALGESMTGEMATSCGLANACFDDMDEVQMVARQKARLIANKPAQSVLLTKSLMRDSSRIIACMKQEKAYFSECLAGAEARAIFERFFNKQAKP